MDVQINPGAEGAPAEAVPAQAGITVISGTGEGRLSVSEAGRMLREARKPKESSTPERANSAAPVDPRIKSGEQESTAGPDPAEDAAPQEEVRSETQSADPVVELPPIEAPRSWTKEDKELFTSLPRETQERVAERERSRESDFLRRQNEAAEKLKGLTAQEQKVEQARQQYESALPLLLDNLPSAMSGEFSGIRTMADIQKMAKEDWPRYVQWDAQQKNIAAVQQEVRAAEDRRTAEFTQQWNEFAKREDSLFTEKVPEMADKDKAAKGASRPRRRQIDAGHHRLQSTTKESDPRMEKRCFLVAYLPRQQLLAFHQRTARQDHVMVSTRRQVR